MSGELYINGAWRAGRGKPFNSIAPATQWVLWSGNEAAMRDVDAAVASAERASKSWRALSLDDRLNIIYRFAGILKIRKIEMATAIAHETGKPLWDAMTEAGAMIGKVDISLKAYHERTGMREQDIAGGQLNVSHRAHGVMAVIGPFNFPGHLPNGHIVPALIAGNTVVFKPSEMTPLVAEKTVQAWHDAGLPNGVINLVHGGRAVAEQLIDHNGVKGICFTGGIHAGRAIHKRLAGRVDKILALELGGNNPLIAWGVDNIDAAAQIILRSVYITSGQRCTCAKRLIIPEGNAGDAIVSRLEALLGRVIVGAPDANPEPFMGPLISQQAADQVFAAQDKLSGEGGVILRACKPMSQSPAYVTPGIIDVTGIKSPRDEEVFGPLLQVIRAGSFDAAIDIANQTEFGLAAGLLSDKRELWDKFSGSIHAGIVNWNKQTTGASGSAPFGGPGLSGNHRAAGYYAADYCAWPMASLLAPGALNDGGQTLGLKS